MEENVLKGFEDRAKSAEEKLEALEKMLGAERSQFTLPTTASDPDQ